MYTSLSLSLTLSLSLYVNTLCMYIIYIHTYTHMYAYVTSMYKETLPKLTSTNSFTSRFNINSYAEIYSSS